MSSIRSSSASTALARGEGFADVVSPELARRQFNVSLGLLLAICIAVVSVAATMGLPSAGSSGEPRVATLRVQQPEFVRPMTAGGAQSDLNGG
ncbi:MAG TPA: hypothetical protein VIL72_15435 [Beijerinckiaceae bacterium]|jgi:hypothetical protein